MNADDSFPDDIEILKRLLCTREAELSQARAEAQAWLANVLARINDHNIRRLDQLLPWNWKSDRAKLAA